MEQFFGVLFIVIIAFYCLKNIFAKFFPRILMWFMRRQVNKHMRDTFGFDPSNGKDSGKSRTRRAASQHSSTPRRKGKIFTKDVGEYVEFEDIKVYQSSDNAATQTVKYTEESQITDVEWEEV